MSWYNPMSWGQRDAPTKFADRGAIDARIKDGFDNSFGAAPTLDMSQQEQFRRMQMQQAQQLQGIASGQQQGAGELAAQRQMQNALAGQQAIARMRGAGGAGMRMAARQSAGLGVTGAGMAQQAGLQDQQMAQAALMNALTQGRGADINIAGQNAQNSLANRQLNNQSYQAMLDALLKMNAAELQAGQANASKGYFGDMLSAGGQIGAAAIK